MGKQKIMHGKNQIGVIISSLHEPCQAHVWTGIRDLASRAGVDLITFVASSQDRGGSLDTHYEIVRDLARNAELDGLLIFSGAIAEHQGAGYVDGYVSALSHVPVVSISLEVPRAPAVLVDNSSGVIQLMDHLINGHGFKNIAFVMGPPGHMEAEERFEAYKKGLALNNLPLNDDLIFPGQFSDDSGTQAVRQMLMEGTPCDAIVTVDDETALGAMRELRRSGRYVPADVAVAGFDDIHEAASVHPSLTTIRAPLYEQGQRALEILMASIASGHPEDGVTLSTTPVYRRSCGCTPATGGGSESESGAAGPVAFNDLVFQTKLSESTLGIDGVSDVNSMARLLKEQLESLGITEFVLCEFGKGNGTMLTQENWVFPSEARVLAGQGMEGDEGKALQPETIFATSKVVPAEMRSRQGADCLLVLPLFSQSELLGYAAFKHISGLPFYVYEELRLKLGHMVARTTQ